jgi:hypothetical protein
LKVFIIYRIATICLRKNQLLQETTLDNIPKCSKCRITAVDKIETARCVIFRIFLGKKEIFDYLLRYKYKNHK